MRLHLLLGVPTAPASVGVELLLWDLAVVLAIAAATGGASPGLLLLHPHHPLIGRQQLAAIRCRSSPRAFFVHRPQAPSQVLNGEGRHVQHRLDGEI